MSRPTKRAISLGKPKEVELPSTAKAAPKGVSRVVRAQGRKVSETSQSSRADQVTSEEITEERSKTEESEERTEGRRRVRVVKSAAVLPKISLENLWENVSRRPPFNPIKTDFLIRYLMENKILIENSQDRLMKLLVLMLTDLPIAEFISANKNVIPNKLTDDEISELKQLLLEFRTAVNNFTDVNVIREILTQLPMTVLESGQLEQIQRLNYRDSNVKIIDLGNRALIYEIFSLLLMIGFDNTYQFLQEVTKSEDIIFNSPTMKPARDKAIIDLNIIRWKPKIVSGNIKCRNCGNDKVNIIEKQIRSADEPMTQFVTCMSCGNKWKIG